MKRVTLILLVLAAACSSGGGSKTVTTVTITYRVGGFATAPKVTYRTATGTTERNVGDPAGQSSLHEEIRVELPAGSPVSLAVEIRYLGGDNVRCTILGSSGQTIADNTASGVVGNKATCDGIAA